MKILYMYAELMGYNIPVLESLVRDFGAEIHLIHWDHKKLTVYQAPQVENVTYYNRSDFQSSKEILELAKLLEPDIAYVPNWYDKGYLSTCLYLRKKNIPVVAGLDNQWKGNLKQRLGIIVMKIYLKRYFSHMWVAGPRQFEFAKRLGFKNRQILFNFYSADVAKFSAIKKEDSTSSLKFLFVGRLEEVKGLRQLLIAWNNLSNKDNCSLTIIGNGKLLSLVNEYPTVTHKPFLQPDELLEEVKNHNCFILPSIYEPYGVVIHEFAAAGMPLIVSDECGAAATLSLMVIMDLPLLQVTTNHCLKKWS